MKKLIAITLLAAPFALLAQSLPANPKPGLNETNAFTGIVFTYKTTITNDHNLKDGVPQVHVGHTHTYTRNVETWRINAVRGKVHTNVFETVVSRKLVKNVEEQYTVPLAASVTSSTTTVDDDTP